LRFLRGYFQQPLRQILAQEAALLSWLESKANKLYARKVRYGDAL
jgi:heptose I phosphotransferase